MSLLTVQEQAKLSASIEREFGELVMARRDTSTSHELKTKAVKLFQEIQRLRRMFSLNEETVLMFEYLTAVLEGYICEDSSRQTNVAVAA